MHLNSKTHDLKLKSKSLTLFPKQSKNKVRKMSFVIPPLTKNLLEVFLTGEYFAKNCIFYFWIYFWSCYCRLLFQSSASKDVFPKYWSLLNYLLLVQDSLLFSAHHDIEDPRAEGVWCPQVSSVSRIISSWNRKEGFFSGWIYIPLLVYRMLFASELHRQKLIEKLCQ